LLSLKKKFEHRDPKIVEAIEALEESIKIIESTIAEYEELEMEEEAKLETEKKNKLKEQLIQFKLKIGVSVETMNYEDLKQQWKDVKDIINNFEKNNKFKDLPSSLKALELLKKEEERLKKTVTEHMVKRNSVALNQHLKIFEIGEDTYVDSKNEEVKRKLMLQSEIRVCFMVDCTGSINPYIGEIKNNIQTIIDTAKENNVLHIFFSFVGYRDFTEDPNSSITTHEEYDIFDFSKDKNEFENFLKSVEPSGGGDTCEDVLGGLSEVIKLSWLPQDDSFKTSNLLIHIADAPNHGILFRNPEHSIDDNFDDYPVTMSPSDIPELNNSLKFLADHNIHYYFFRVSDTTDVMIEKFNELFGTLCNDGRSISVDDINEKTIRNIIDKIICNTITVTATSSATNSREVQRESFRIGLKIEEGKNVEEKVMWPENALSGILINIPDEGTTLDDMITDITFKLESSEYNIFVANYPFNKGSERYCFMTSLAKTLGYKYFDSKGVQKFVRSTELKHGGVVKNFIDPKRSSDFYINSIRVQKVASDVAKKFNTEIRGLRTSPIEFVQASLFVVPEKKVEEVTDVQKLRSIFQSYPFSKIYFYEKQINGEYVKFSNNFGYVRKSDKNEEEILKVALAFSHYSYKIFNCEGIIVDIQGVFDKDKGNFLFTDPAIHHKKKFSSDINYYEEGIKKFFATHECNALCKDLGLEKLIPLSGESS
jgi:hypothetical protein